MQAFIVGFPYLTQGYASFGTSQQLKNDSSFGKIVSQKSSEKETLSQKGVVQPVPIITKSVHFFRQQTLIVVVENSICASHSTLHHPHISCKFLFESEHPPGFHPC